MGHWNLEVTRKVKKRSQENSSADQFRSRVLGDHKVVTQGMVTFLFHMLIRSLQISSFQARKNLYNKPIIMTLINKIRAKYLDRPYSGK